MPVFKVVSECYVEAPTLEQAVDAQVDQLTLKRDGEGFHNPEYGALLGSGSHFAIACEDDETPATQPDPSAPTLS